MEDASIIPVQGVQLVSWMHIFVFTMVRELPSSPAAAAEFPAIAAIGAAEDGLFISWRWRISISASKLI